MLLFKSLSRLALVVIAILLGMVIVGLMVWVAYNRRPVTYNLPAISEIITKPSPSPQPPIRLLFGGDLMFDRHVRLRMQESGTDIVFSELTSTFEQYDVVVANLEGPVTTSPSRSVGSVVGSTNNFIFTFDPSIVPMLARHNVSIVSLGNNHITNFGVDGVRQTKQFLTDGGVSFFGNTSTEKTPVERVLINSDLSPTLAFVGYNQFVSGGFEAALEDVRYATTAAQVVIVMPHWGNEYQPTANKVIQNEAHQLIDVGADLIIGGHPHVVQQSEVYKGKTIYYSLGNFVFDQYFSPEVQRGLLVGVEIFPDELMTFTELPIKIEKTGQTKLLETN